MESAATITSERGHSREGEQANYFYVVWPEETVTTLSAAGRLDPTLCSTQVHKATATAGLHRHPHPLQNHKHREQQSQRHGPGGMEPSSVASLSPTEKPLPEIEVGSFASPLTSPILSIADASPLVTQSSAPSPPRDYVEKTSHPGISSSECNLANTTRCT